MYKRFIDIIQIIKQSRANAIKVVNAELINLYWNIGEYISKKLERAEWGDSVVAELAKYIQQNEPEIKGFSDKNLWRMKQFYETYKDYPKLSAVVREISWSHNLAIFSRCKSTEEREFYLKLSKQENYSFRELDRQISASLFERTMIGNKKLSTALRETNPDISNTFKDSYVFDFLNLPEPYEVCEGYHPHQTYCNSIDGLSALPYSSTLTRYAHCRGTASMLRTPAYFRTTPKQAKEDFDLNFKLIYQISA